jgi:hypothetical protein
MWVNDTIEGQSEFSNIPNRILKELVLNRSTLINALGSALNYQRIAKREQNLLTIAKKTH